MGISTDRLPELWNMTLYAGDTWPAYNFNVLIDGAAGIGFSVLMQVRRSAGLPPIKTISNTNGFRIVSNNVAFNTTVNMPIGKYIYDIQITLPNGEIHTQYAGTITVTSDVTR